MSHTTQCPSCQTRFKVTDAHLSLAGGMVRCGRCNHVFHAPSHIADSAIVAPPPPVVTAPPAPARQDDDFELELPDFSPEPSPTPPPASATRPELPISHDDDDDFALPEFDLLQAAPADTPPPAIRPDFRAAAVDAEADSRQQLAEFQQALNEALRPTTADTPAPLAANPFTPPPPPSREQATLRHEPLTVADIEAELQQPAAAAAATPPEQRRPWWLGTLQALLAVLLLLSLLAQMLFINRTRVSAEVPELRPAFETVCASLGCSVPLPTDRQLIRTEWSELSFVPQHDDLIQLGATLKNHAPYPQAFPLMELSLKDAEDKVVIRKTYTPDQYLTRQDYQLGQFNANSELKLQLRMQLQQGKALGYSLHFFYP